MEDFLDVNQFVRVHQSYLVNASQIVWFDKITSQLILVNGEEIPVSQRKKADLPEKFDVLKD